MVADVDVVGGGECVRLWGLDLVCGFSDSVDLLEGKHNTVYSPILQRIEFEVMAFWWGILFVAVLVLSCVWFLYISKL